MPYFQIQDFRLGMDRRRPLRAVGETGSCWILKNGHITRGGDAERRKRFVATYTLPAGTKGALAVNNTLFVFGAGVDPGVPSGVTYQRLQHPTSGSAVITEVVDAAAFDGNPYVIARFDDGNVYHYYNGARVTDWDSLAQDIGTNNAVATALADRVSESSAVSATASTNIVTITASTAGVPYTVAASTINNGSVGDEAIALAETQANVEAVDEVLATANVTITGGTFNPGTNQVTSITVDGVDILGSAVDWSTSNSTLAGTLASTINTYASSPEYAAQATGPILTISAAAGSGAGANGFLVVVNTAGDVTETSDASLSGGVSAVSAVAQVYTATVTGTFEPADVFAISINGTEYSVTGRASGTGLTALPFRQKLYSIAGSNLYFSDLNSPTQWVQSEDAVDPGFINMSAQEAGQEELAVTAEYQGLMAVFSRNSVRIWSIVESSASNVMIQTLQATGTRSPKSVVPFGNDDVFYLSDTGVRSLKARDSSNSAYVSDVGTPLDKYIQEYMTTLTSDQIASAVAVIEPLDGRYWLAIGQRIFVFSFFPSAKISAWSYYDLADDVGAEITEFTRIGDRVYARAGDTIFLYGGPSNATYPGANEVEIEVGLPYIHANQPATNKRVLGFDVFCQNQWAVSLLTDPTDETVEETAGVASKTTYGKGHHLVYAWTAMFAPKLVCSRAGSATLSGLAIHYGGGESG